MTAQKMGKRVKLLQHVYTSRVRLGYGTIFCAPEIEPYITTLEDQGQYKRPREIDPDAPLEQFPVQYKYYLLPVSGGNHWQVFVRSAYLGLDYHSGRFGNFIAHSLVYMGQDLNPQVVSNTLIKLKEKGFYPQFGIEQQQGEFEMEKELELPTEGIKSVFQSHAVELLKNDAKQAAREAILAYIIEYYYEYARNIVANNPTELPAKKFIIEDEQDMLVHWIQAIMIGFPKQVSKEISFNTHWVKGHLKAAEINGLIPSNRYLLRDHLSDEYKVFSVADVAQKSLPQPKSGFGQLIAKTMLIGSVFQFEAACEYLSPEGLKLAETPTDFLGFIGKLDQISGASTQEMDQLFSGLRGDEQKAQFLSQAGEYQPEWLANHWLLPRYRVGLIKELRPLIDAFEKNFKRTIEVKREEILTEVLRKHLSGFKEEYRRRELLWLLVDYRGSLPVEIRKMALSELEKEVTDLDIFQIALASIQVSLETNNKLQQLIAKGDIALKSKKRKADEIKAMVEEYFTEHGTYGSRLDILTNLMAEANVNERNAEEYIEFFRKMVSGRSKLKLWSSEVIPLNLPRVAQLNKILQEQYAGTGPIKHRLDAFREAIGLSRLFEEIFLTPLAETLAKAKKVSSKSTGQSDAAYLHHYIGELEKQQCQSGDWNSTPQKKNRIDRLGFITGYFADGDAESKEMAGALIASIKYLEIKDQEMGLGEEWLVICESIRNRPISRISVLRELQNLQPKLPKYHVVTVLEDFFKNFHPTDLELEQGLEMLRNLLKSFQTNSPYSSGDEIARIQDILSKYDPAYKEEKEKESNEEESNKSLRPDLRDFASDLEILMDQKEGHVSAISKALADRFCGIWTYAEWTVIIPVLIETGRKRGKAIPPNGIQKALIDHHSRIKKRPPETDEHLPSTPRLISTLFFALLIGNPLEDADYMFITEKLRDLIWKNTSLDIERHKSAILQQINDMVDGHPELQVIVRNLFGKVSSKEGSEAIPGAENEISTEDELESHLANTSKTNNDNTSSENDADSENQSIAEQESTSLEDTSTVPDPPDHGAEDSNLPSHSEAFSELDTDNISND